jgi:hypothetical protein
MGHRMGRVGLSLGDFSRDCCLGDEHRLCVSRCSTCLPTCPLSESAKVLSGTPAADLEEVLNHLARNGNQS